MKKITLQLFLLFSISIIGQTTYNIDDPEDLRNVIYQPGDEIILKNGTYSTDERMIFLGSGTAENPVTFRAETPGGVIFTGGPRLTIGGESDGDVTATGEYLVVDGFHWKGGYGASNFIEFRNGYDYAHHSTIQNCVIDGLGIESSELAEDLADEQISKHRWIVLYGTYNTVINCSFMNKVSAGAIILGEYAYNAFPNVADGEPEINNSCQEVGHKIMNNYFFNYEKMTEKYGTKANGDALSNSGDSETIRIGTSSNQMVNSKAIVSNNYFVQADGENEIITNKSKGNTYTNNTFRRCRGSLVLRHGSNATLDGNYFLGEDVEGTGGIRIVDSEHTITNNYIQDCITEVSNAKWNNGITFLGGSANAAVACTSDNVSNGYQKVENINLSNNTIINTNAPLFYNEDKGSTDPRGTVSNNLIYFAESDPNLTAVISGDSETAFNNLGTGLTYTGNVFVGTSLGATSPGFSEEAGITATASGEIFTFSGATGKGADMGTYVPTTDAMVGHGIGACFADYTGANITNGDCTITVSESLTVSSLSVLDPIAESYDVSVTANIAWTAASNDSWITIDVNSGTGNATVSITVTKNDTTSARTGSVTFTQVAGGDDIVRMLSITQNGADLTSIYDLINTGDVNDPVSVHSFSEQQDENHSSPKTNYATNTLDKDNGSVWAADDDAVLSGDYKGDGEYIIYDLGSTREVNVVQFTTTNKSDSFGFQVWASSTGTDLADFTKKLPISDDLLLTATGTTDFNQYEISGGVNARYIKLIGFGRFNSDGDSRESAWSAVGEIEFYGASSLSVNNYNALNEIAIYPVPANNVLYIKSVSQNIKEINIYSIDGRKVLEKKMIDIVQNANLDVSRLKSGLYIVKIEDGYSSVSKLITIK
ncbi:T9SS type A sorting domain-containing protein [Polaribacter sp.]|nr:T9SS type A sorting domain-containing protein [Polaribacter sp.]